MYIYTPQFSCSLMRNESISCWTVKYYFNLLTSFFKFTGDFFGMSYEADCRKKKKSSSRKISIHINSVDFNSRSLRSTVYAKATMLWTTTVENHLIGLYLSAPFSCQKPTTDQFNRNQNMSLVTRHSFNTSNSIYRNRKQTEIEMERRKYES